MKIIISKENLNRLKISLHKKKNLSLPVWIFKYGLEGILIIFAIGYLFYDNFMIGFIFFPYIFFHVKSRRKQEIQKQKNKFSIAFRDAMHIVSGALNAGYSIENSFAEALPELDMMYGRQSKIYKEFKKIKDQISLNINIEQAFSDFAKESQIEEIISFSEVLYYAKRSGGDLIKIIKNTTDTISSKMELDLEIQTIISAKQLEQKIMNGVPIGIILYMRASNGALFTKLYGNLTGIFTMTVCLVVYFFSILISKHIVNIRI